MAIVQTYHTFHRQIRQMLPVKHVSRLRNLAWLMAGIYSSRSVHLSHVASRIPGRTKRRSRTRRISRFLHNGHVRVRQWYEPVAGRLLAEVVAKGQMVQLIIDATKVTNGHQLLMVAIAYRGRALPLTWTWIRNKKGHSSGRKQKALLAYVHHLMPGTAEVVVMGDSEFTPLQDLLETWGWHYILRQKGSHTIRCDEQDSWRRVDELVTGPGQDVWLDGVQLTQKYHHDTNFLAIWRPGYATPWLLATNLSTRQATLRFYKRRMWIEEMFGDFKSHGFDLEKSRLRHFLCLSRLTLVVALLYVWLVALGATSIKRGQRHLVDRNDRRDLSVFRIGYDMFRHLVMNDQPCLIRACPYFV